MVSQELRIRRLLVECAGEGLRGSQDLWPRIRAQVSARRARRRRVAAYGAAALAGAALLALAVLVRRPAPPAPGEAVVPLVATQGVSAVTPASEAGTPLPGVLLAHLLSLEELRAQVPFALRTPAWLPEGLALEGGSVEGSGDALQAVLEYRAAGAEAGPAPLRQWVSARPLPSPPLPSPGQGTPAVVNGQPAAFAEGSTGDLPAPAWLVWQEDGLSYALEGHGLGLEELVRIAESLQ